MTEQEKARQEYETAKRLTGEAQTIEDEIFKHNSGLAKKMSIRCIQHMIASLAREYAALYKDVGEKDR